MTNLNTGWPVAQTGYAVSGWPVPLRGYYTSDNSGFGDASGATATVAGAPKSLLYIGAGVALLWLLSKK